MQSDKVFPMMSQYEKQSTLCKKTWGSRDARLGSSQLDQSKLEEIFKEWSSNENKVKLANALA